MNKAYKNISCFITIWNDSKIKNKNPINSFLQLDSIALENFDEEHEQTSDQKFRKRKYWFIYQKKSDADSRLIDCQDNTLTYIWWFNYWKKKNQKNLDVGLTGFIRSKGNSDVASKISYQIFFYTNKWRKWFIKIDEKNKLFILPQQISVNLLY